MIFFFYGKNKQKEKAKKLYESLRLKKPDATFLSYDEENISESVLKELVESQGLFEKKIVCLFNKILNNKEFEKTIFGKIKELAESPNIFIWYEEKLLKDEVKKIGDKAEKKDIEDPKPTVGRGGEFNMFALSDAFGKRDKKHLWELFLKAKEKGSAEEIHGILYWQLKAIASASFAKDATDADLKPFVYGKAKAFARNFSEKEIKDLMEKFIEMYHEAHRGKVDFMLALERMILDL